MVRDATTLAHQGRRGGVHAITARSSNRCFERIESLFAAIAESGVERLPADRRYARRERALRDGIALSDPDWARLQELLT